MKTVNVPDKFAPLFEKAQDYVRRYFADRHEDPTRASVEVSGERYMLVRASSMSVEFFDMVRELYQDEGESQGLSVARSILFDLAHAMGIADAKAFAERMGVTDPVERLSAGPIHFAHAGWAFVHLHEQSSPTPDQDYCIVYDHPYSFESDSWLSAGKPTDAPVCVMSAGYSSGWCESSYGFGLVATEILCRAKGDAHCRFIMAPPEQIERRINEYLESEPELAKSVGSYEIPGFFARQKSESALQRKNVELSELKDRIIEALPGGLVHIDNQGSILQANAEACRLLGYSFDGITQRYVVDWEGETIWEDGRPAEVQDYPASQVLATGKPHGPVTLGVRRPDGELTWAVFTAVPVKGEDGSTAAAIVTFLDITRRKRAEEERRQLEAKMREAQKLESLGVLAGGIAHDFNNLLVGVLGNAGLAKDDVSPGTELYESLCQIELAAQSASQLTKQMLAYSGRGRFQTRAMDLSVEVREIGELVAASVPKNVRFKYALGAGLPPIDADVAQLRQVIMNLIVNASESIEGQGCVCVESGHCTVDPATSGDGFVLEPITSGDYVFFAVKDDGCGMDPETVERIFDPFFTTKFSGRGLGLAAVAGIMRGHAGAIHIETRVGQGTKFRMLFPVSAATAPAVVAGQRATATDGTEIGGEILVVDDEQAVRRVIGRMLGRVGCKVHTAVDGVDGVAQFEQLHTRLSAVVLDLTMPGLGGADAFERMQALDPKVPVVLVSGYNEEEALERYEGAGWAGFVQKPFSADALIAGVRSAIRAGKNRR